MSLLDFFFASGSSIAPKTLHFWHGLRTLGVAIALMLLFSIVWALVSPSSVGFVSWWVAGIHVFFMSAVFAGCALFAVRRLGYVDFSLIIGTARRPLAVLVAAAGVIPMGILADESAFLLHRLRPDIFNTDVLDELSGLFVNAPLYGAILLSAAIAIGPAVGEELMFRGLLLKSFRRDMPVAWAILFSSILFGVVHFNWLQGVAAGILGLYLGVVTVLTGSIYAAMAAHFANNLLAAVVSRTGLFDMSHGAVEGYPVSVLVLATMSLAALVFLLWKLRPR